MKIITKDNRLINLEHFAGVMVVDSFAKVLDTHAVQPYEADCLEVEHNLITTLYEGTELECHAVINALYKNLQTNVAYYHYSTMVREIERELLWDNTNFWERMKVAGVNVPEEMTQPQKEAENHEQ